MLSEQMSQEQMWRRQRWNGVASRSGQTLKDKNLNG